MSVNLWGQKKRCLTSIFIKLEILDIFQVLTNRGGILLITLQWLSTEINKIWPLPTSSPTALILTHNVQSCWPSPHSTYLLSFCLKCPSYGRALAIIHGPVSSEWHLLRPQPAQSLAMPFPCFNFLVLLYEISFVHFCFIVPPSMNVSSMTAGILSFSQLSSVPGTTGNAQSM